MERVVLSGLLCLLLVTVPNPVATAMPSVAFSHAQQNRTIVDMRTRIEPASSSGHCIELDPGVLIISAQAVTMDGFSLQPVRFTFSGYRGLDQHADTSVLLSSGPSRFDRTLSGGMYCYALRNETIIPPNASSAEATNLSQWVDLRMELAY